MAQSCSHQTDSQSVDDEASLALNALAGPLLIGRKQPSLPRQTIERSRLTRKDHFHLSTSVRDSSALLD